jgi:hypothetical protein
LGYCSGTGQSSGIPPLPVTGSLYASPLMRSGQLTVNPPMPALPYRRCRRMFWPESALRLPSVCDSRVPQVSEAFCSRRRYSALVTVGNPDCRQQSHLLLLRVWSAASKNRSPNCESYVVPGANYVVLWRCECGCRACLPSPTYRLPRAFADAAAGEPMAGCKITLFPAMVRVQGSKIAPVSGDPRPEIATARRPGYRSSSSTGERARVQQIITKRRRPSASRNWSRWSGSPPR